VVTDTDGVTALLHRHGALSFWDYAAAGPDVPIRMAESGPGRGDGKDAVFFSPHKLVGGPQTPGVLVVRRALVTNRVPTAPGGGTVAFVSPDAHRYLEDPVDREEGATPAIVESVRAGLVFALKEAVGTDLIRSRDERLSRDALQRWSTHRRIEVLGNPQAVRLPIVSFRIRAGILLLHHNFVVAVLNERSRAFDAEVARGHDGIKPGWTRLTFGYFMSDTVGDYLVDSVLLIAEHDHRLLPEYRFDAHTGLWRHARADEFAPKIPDLRDFPASAPGASRRLGEDALSEHLGRAGEMLTSLPDPVLDGGNGLSAGFESLRWFPCG
jgi:selenocysteine lyase/cysteine desulfurase